VGNSLCDKLVNICFVIVDAVIKVAVETLDWIVDEFGVKFDVKVGKDDKVVVLMVRVFDEDI